MVGKGKENIHGLKAEDGGPMDIDMPAVQAPVLLFLPFLRTPPATHAGPPQAQETLPSRAGDTNRPCRRPGWCMQGAGKGKRVMGGAPSGGRKKGKDATELQLEQLVDARDVALATGAIDPEAHRRTEIVPIADVSWPCKRSCCSMRPCRQPCFPCMPLLASTEHVRTFFSGLTAVARSFSAMLWCWISAAQHACMRAWVPAAAPRTRQSVLRAGRHQP